MPLKYSSFNLQSLYSVWQLEVISVICLQLKQGINVPIYVGSLFVAVIVRNILKVLIFNIVDLKITNQIGDVALGISYLLR